METPPLPEAEAAFFVQEQANQLGTDSRVYFSPGLNLYFNFVGQEDREHEQGVYADGRLEIFALPKKEETSAALLLPERQVPQFLDWVDAQFTDEEGIQVVMTNRLAILWSDKDDETIYDVSDLIFVGEPGFTSAQTARLNAEAG